MGLDFLLQGFRGGFAQIAYELFAMWKSRWPSGAVWDRNPQQIASSIGGVIGGAVVFVMAARLNLLREVRGAYDETMGLKDSEPDDR